MKKILIILYCFFFILPCVSQSEVDSITISNINLPILSIYTQDSIMPTCDYVFAPKGEFGVTTTNKTVIPGRIILSEGSNILFDSGEYEKDKGGMTIKIRGNTSAYYSNKKPYKIKLEKKGDLFGRNDERYFDKNWILIDEGCDNMNTKVGLKLNELLGLGNWTPAYRYVNLFFNGHYHGVYMLLESIKRNTDCRINISKQGYLIECNPYWWNEPIYFKSNMNKKYTFKYPDDDNITEEQIEYIKQQIDLFEESIIEGNYIDYIDIESFALWVLAHDILGNSDSAGSNIFITKYDNSSYTKLMMSTLWDFNGIFRTKDNWGKVHSDYFYYQQLFQNNNPIFASAYKYYWKKKGKSTISSLENYLNEYLNSEEAQGINDSRVYEEARWNYPSEGVDNYITLALNWLKEREDWLNDNIEQIDVPDYENYINNIKVVNYSYNNNTYTLKGQKINDNKPLKPGIYIRNGHKFIVK